MTQRVDNRGRVYKITGPNEYDANDTSKYTIKFAYNPQKIEKIGNTYTQMPYAITQHFDATQLTDKNLETVTFVDGFGRPIQVKKESMVDGAPKMIVSGLARYDAFGRVKETFYPVVDDLSNKTNLNTAFDNSVPPTTTTYDILDRVTKTRLPDSTETNFAYSSMDGLLKTTVIDAKNNKQETFTNGSGLTVKSLQYKHIDPDTVLTTLFEYDDVNQLKKVTDDAGKTTESFYDWAGNRTQVKHPASDTTTFGYDPAGNTLWKYTANKDSILYGYEYNRLTTISYPRHPENNVVYTYGLAQTSDNRAGRLVGIEDGSGAQEFKYGRQGEVTEVRRTLVIPNQGVASYVTKTEYDSWNRLLKMTYPDGEVVNYSYNTGGLLAGVTGNKGSETTNYVTDIRYDKFEQRSYLKYGNGAETNYTYKPDNRLLNTLSVQKGTAMLMNNAYTYDDVQNIKRVINTGSTSNSIGGQMEHRYYYDNLYRLDSASGDFIGNNGKKARYRLSMEYDNMHNITRKKQDIVQNDLKFTGILNAGYDLSYTYADNSQQIANIAEQSYRIERASGATYQTGIQSGDVVSAKTQSYTYDPNGNMTFVASGKLLSDSTLQATSTRTMLWDEENRLLGISDNGYVSNYWYDATGERTVKQSGGSEGVFVNGVLSGARTGTNKFTAYVSPYLVVSNGGNYTKHIYMGSQRITSKVSNSGIFTSRNPLTDTTALNNSYSAKLASLTGKIKERFDSLGVVYNGTPQTRGMISSNPASTASSYFYHSDHLGSSSLITDGTGALVQHIEYVPFGETFIDERNGNWRTPYLFNGKEKDEETGLHYYGARYYDSRLGVWLSVDPLAEKYPNVSSYVYCSNNPVMRIDPDGKDDTYYNSSGEQIGFIKRSKFFEFFHRGDRSFIFDDNGEKYRLTNQALEVINSGKYEGFDSNWESSDTETGFISLLRNATEPKGKENKYSYIIRESQDGGFLDQKMNLNPFKIYGASGKAMNRNEAGNYVWGAALATFGISTKYALFFADGGTLYLEVVSRPNIEGRGWSINDIGYRLSKVRFDETDEKDAIKAGSVKIIGFLITY